MKKLLWLAVVWVFGFSSYGYAFPSPVPLLQETSDAMIAALYSNKAQLKTNPAIVHGIVRRVLLPHVDVLVMSKLVLGRNAWTDATAAQRQRFTQQFTVLLIRNYSTALTEFSNEKVEFSPIRGGPPSRNRVKVDSRIVQMGGPSIPVSYRLVYRDGSWKVYDLVIDNISLVESYRSQFADILSKAGVNGLLKQLDSKNGE